MQKQLAIKVMTIFVIGLIILIPVTMVKQKVHERHRFQELAVSDVAQSWTGPQKVFSPVLVFPYRLSSESKSGFYSDMTTPSKEKISVILPDHLKTQMKASNQSIYKGIYEIPVFNSEISFSGHIDQQKIAAHIRHLKSLHQFESLGEPYLSLYISDVRGVNTTPTLQVNNTSIVLHPSSRLAALASGVHAMLNMPLEGSDDLNFNVDLSLRGMASLSFVQLADDAQTVMQSSWPHPEFIGASLPAERDISASGFTARWLATRYSSNSADALGVCLDTHQCSQVLNAASGVNFIEPVDIYLQSERSVKYAILFIGLSFITFFIFENIKRIPIHPIQYAFVGLAIAVFYLLLISLAEHLAFYWAYLIAVVCCSGLLLFYVRYMLRSVVSALLFSSMILGLYGLLYVIVQAEDFALLMGAVLVFLVLAVLMFVTRKIDWYSLQTVDTHTRTHEVAHSNTNPPQ